VYGGMASMLCNDCQGWVSFSAESCSHCGSARFKSFSSSESAEPYREHADRREFTDLRNYISDVSIKEFNGVSLFSGAKK